MAEMITTLAPADASTATAPASTGWATIPIEDDPTPAELAATLTLVTDLADFNAPLPIVSATDPTAISQRYGADMAFDFEAGEPAGLLSGHPAYVTGDPQVIAWIRKAFATSRGRYLIYGPGYGTICRSLVGQAAPDQPLFSELARTTKECVLEHPRVTSCVVDAVYRQELVAPDAIFIGIRIVLDSSDDFITFTLAAS